MIDLLFRCETRARWQALAVNRGIYVQNGSSYITQPGYFVDEIGFYPLGPETVDTWWSVNLRIDRTDDEDTLYPGETGNFRFVRSKLVRFIRNQATQTTFSGMRAYQFGNSPNRVQVIDSRDLTPKRVWLGGMSF